MSDDAEAIRHQAAVLARRKRDRIVQFSPDAPCDWRPESMNTPQVGAPFNETTAWEYIADLLEPENHPIECIILNKPPGKKGYVMTPSIGDKEVYIKFMLGAGKIIGRSFHYSNHP